MDSREREGAVGRTLPTTGFSAKKIHNVSEVGTRIVAPDGEIAVLTGAREPQHPTIRNAADAIVEHATRSDRRDGR